MGATRARLARFLLVESLILSCLGGLLGVGLARAVLWLIVQMRPAGQLGGALAGVGLDATVLGYAVAITMLAGMVFGTLPALRSARDGQRGALQESDPRVGGGHSRLRSVLVVSETALSVVLLVTAGLTFRSFVELRFTDPGFDAGRVLSVGMSLPETRYPTASEQQVFFDALLREVGRVAGIEAVSLGHGALPPSDLATGGELLIEGRESPTSEVWVSWSVVREGFLGFMGIPLLAGRDLSAADVREVESAAEVPVAVNRSLAQRFWPDGDALGARFRFSLDAEARWKRIVGIAANVTQQGFATGTGPQLYEPLSAPDPRYTELLIRLKGRVAPPIQEIRGVIGRLDPLIPIDDLDTAGARLIETVSEPRFRAVLFGASGALSMVLVGLGVSGVVAYSVSQRTREMGIRLALGAQPGDVRRLVLTQGMAPVAGGIVLGGLAALAVTRLMTEFLYAVDPTDPLTFATTSSTLLVVAALAAWLPARRATRIDPVLALRATSR